MSNQQLPFDPSNTMSQPMQFNQPPFVPNNLQLPQDFANLLPTVAMMVANEVSSNCNKNAGRMFLFNQLSNNNYANQDFVEAIQTAMDMLLLGLFKGQYNNPNQGLPDAVNKALIMCNAANFQKFPTLQQYVHPELLSDVSRIVNSLQGVKSDIMNAKNQTNQVQQYQPMQQQPINNGNSGYYNQNMGNRFAQPNQGSFQSTRMQPGLSINSNPTVFTNNPVQQAQPFKNAGPTNLLASRYDYLKTNVTDVAPVAPLVSQSNYFQSPAPQADDKVLVWKPSPAQWHPATCNTKLQKITLKEIKWADDNNYVVSIAINLTEEEMQEANHKIGFTETAMMSTTPDKYGSRQQAIVDNIDSFVERSREIREDKPVADEEQMPAFSISNTARRTVCANFLAPAIFSGRVMMKKDLEQTEDDLVAYGVNAIVAMPMLTDDTQEKLLSQLKDCKTFLRIQAVLKNALTGKAVSSMSKELAARIDKIFTKEINSILNNRLSLDVNIGSFVEDSVDLITHLKNTYGDLFSTAYLSCQETFVETYLNQILVSDDMHARMCVDLELTIEESDLGSKYAVDDMLPVAFITQYFAFTYLQVQSADLSINKFGQVATEVLLSKNPELYKLALEMFDEEETKVIPFAHRLLITSDNVIYEFHKGLINKDFVTISKFH